MYRRPEHRKNVNDFSAWLDAHPEETARPSSAVTTRIRHVFHGYRSTMDAPLCDLVPELFATYPSAKFILSVRTDGPEGWYQSWVEALGWHFNRDLGRTIFRTLIYPSHLLRTQDDCAQWARKRLIRDFGGKLGPHLYTQHNALVRDTIPKGQLLEFNVKEGWEPLCEFLGVEVPRAEFPNINERKGIKAVYTGMMVYGAICWGFYGGLVAGGVFLVRRPEAVRGFVETVTSWFRQ
jgi:hypothetical protein